MGLQRAVARRRPARDDRIHFIARQVERLDDHAFAAFLAWFDQYADLRWAGRFAADGAGLSGAVAATPRPPASATLGNLVHAAWTTALTTGWIACEPAPTDRFVRRDPQE
ncbi:MAG TPA: hypothetical protein VGR63_04445 [Casimicrobiaceae bacterium]|nr:hypothetical protein [Casimicrobiaceae bacterium]